ncbi:hypothetical protein [Fluviicola taffensis]|uniref:Uncharacterized protein n=1 Tax=Fluviicola taffensis (strain DSM 16823 / NCIMB 13979 / RW262) TaxID=755732 RepID=F2ICS6_FLUTR|nr:hypothetical protein [Fluviicola taffensis]AEA43300.1 hypothetical protein Fluta_1305 [Fluviicola taffensis DSM 16823]
MTPKKAILFQTFIEGLIPILGYFYWEWDASFILLFYLIDWILFWILSVLKAQKRIQFSETVAEKKLASKRLSIAFLCILSTSLALFYTLPNIHSIFSWKERIWAFLTYSDLGIQQGILLIPLMTLSGYLAYKQQFLIPQLFRKYPVSQFTREPLKQGIILTIIFGIVLLVSYFYPFPEEVLIFGTVGGVIAYRLFSRSTI